MSEDTQTPFPVYIPLVNPNESEALLVELFIQEGEYVECGQSLGILETTKSTLDFSAEAAGYVAGLSLSKGTTVRAGTLLCYLAKSPDWQPATLPVLPGDHPHQADVPAELRISQPALALARQHNLDLSGMTTQTFITEAMVRVMIDNQQVGDQSMHAEKEFDPAAIVVYGGGGHGKALIELLRMLRTYKIVGIIDDGIPITETIMGLPVLGAGEILPGLYRQGVRLAVNAVGGIGDFSIRKKIFRRLADAGFACPALIHPSAFVEASASLAAGVQVMPQAYIGSDVVVGFGVIVNTGVIVSHDCWLGDFANLSPGAILAGEVKIGQAVLVGMGATINLRVQIGDEARIGNGATVKSEVPANSLVRAGAIWPV